MTQQQQLLLAGDIIHRRYQIHRLLGRGAYANVYLAQDLHSSNWIAIKSLPPCLNAKQRLLQRTEIGLHARLSSTHPHIIRLHKVIRTPTDDALSTHLVLEYGPEGDLFTAITEHQLYVNQPVMIRHVFLQLIDAVRHCHQNGVYHRDLKSENILVFDKGWTVKLGDFGLATTDPISKDYGCGSTFYFSPECQGDLDDQRLGYATAPNDIWSLGIILINLTTGRNPWHRASVHDPTFRMYMMDSSLLMTMLPTLTVELHAILKQMLSIDPLQRMSLDALESAIMTCPAFFTTEQPLMMINTLHQQQSVGLPSPPTTPGRPLFFYGEEEKEEIQQEKYPDQILFSPIDTVSDHHLFLNRFSTLSI
ncbi:kinase-like domain-containing protein [Chlamydoabsidia padenii]|nr:kinase-like domain-containing protein [Chlamydoabsidia padenii]